MLAIACYFIADFSQRDACSFFLQLRLHPEKTRLIEFGRYAVERRNKRGQGQPETFNFLGFTHICGQTRKGAFTIKRKSIAKKMRAKLQEVKTQLLRCLHVDVKDTGRWLCQVVRGWFNYHAVPGNYPCLDQFRSAVQRLWLRTLRRRSQRPYRKAEDLSWYREWADLGLLIP